MHIFGILTTVIMVLYLLDRFGIDIGWLNPFHWRRRRNWSKQYHGDPIYAVEDPLHVASLLIIGVAKLEGDLSTEQKQTIKEEFSSNFTLTENEAAELLASAGFLLAAPQLVSNQLQQLAKKNKNSFSSEQSESMLKMMESVAASEGEVSEGQRDYINSLREQFEPPAKNTDSPWG